MAESVVQAPIQGALGGTGEALGQIASEGRITSWSDVLAEMVGEFTTAPQEIATAGHRAYLTHQVEKAKAEVRTQHFKDLGQLARENVLAERAPDVAESYFQEVGDAVGHSEVYIDAQAVQDAGLAEALMQLSPHCRRAVPRGFAVGKRDRYSRGRILGACRPLGHQQ